MTHDGAGWQVLFWGAAQRKRRQVQHSVIALSWGPGDPGKDGEPGGRSRRGVAREGSTHGHGVCRMRSGIKPAVKRLMGYCIPNALAQVLAIRKKEHDTLEPRFSRLPSHFLVSSRKDPNDPAALGSKGAPWGSPVTSHACCRKRFEIMCCSIASC